MAGCRAPPWSRRHSPAPKFRLNGTTYLPMVFLVFFFQRYIIKSIATTGGK
jgi:hypothetical protein